ncbi:GFA family protein [Alicycliphilus denitrificans]|uniref:Glutathione-dependent formaldehyde-activating GFA n=1 Tax=Alicycliphilus denitrificans (strain DSM 14773 / CIP 107495 / K601) TaxID=596154 RepID=F4G455_ALIDK|nr:GFA family protein [Alicycliphilus denitrificans]AEB85199.1 glutathione-dependent formaldehyde-activating GFA [Alicycliphilus denitrificans K601]
MQYKASCHCGKVAMEFEGDIQEVVSCNCSICQRKGALLWFMPRGELKLISPNDAASTYQFHKHAIRHRFCPTCGIHPYAEGVDPKGRPMAAINVRCVHDIDLASLSVKHFDGRSL